ncbi:hypothetical protein PVAP13_8NG312731 [Panicum virgatum]|uniref:Retrovirus-related Pol polyprotein from transposon TNT 1-94-like beta-barrel domain-containing protein n=1 Tax=Panicum virgatum TaxID=38727 RepID=A0A8T0PAL3_PANVG|nr:hypothetical protein PVAP13_8NG312731 [Panicum virgatum]
MPSPPARSFPSYFLERLFPKLLGTQPPVRDDGYTSDAIPSPRNGDPNKGITTCGAALEQEGETLRQDMGNHGCILQLTKELGPLPEFAFIVDSGASMHVVGDISILTSVRMVTPPSGIDGRKVRMRDGRQLPIAGVGTIDRDAFHLSDVLYVPGFDAGVILVSVSKLGDRGYTVMLGRGQCLVQDPSSGDVVGKGQLHDEDGLYHLEYLKIPPDTSEGTVPPCGPLHCHPAIS